MPLVNGNRLKNFNVQAVTGNGYAYFYLQDSANLLTQTHDVRYRLSTALDNFKTVYTSYTGIYINSGGVFDFRNKALKFTGLSGTTVNPNGSGNGYYVPANT